jgi:hypothetical protein
MIDISLRLRIGSGQKAVNTVKLGSAHAKLAGKSACRSPSLDALGCGRNTFFAQAGCPRAWISPVNPYLHGTLQVGNSHSPFPVSNRPATAIHVASPQALARKHEK